MSENSNTLQDNGIAATPTPVTEESEVTSPPAGISSPDVSSTPTPPDTPTDDCPQGVTIPRDAIETSNPPEKSTSDLVRGLDEQVKPRDRTETEYESDKGYREITNNVIDISKDYLTQQRENKKELRKNFSVLFTVLISAQYGFIVLFIILNSIDAIKFTISDEILRLYIVSVFLETLSAMAVMIAFAFVSTEETKIVELLNAIIINYQKFTLGQSAGENSKNTPTESEKKQTINKS